MQVLRYACLIYLLVSYLVVRAGSQEDILRSGMPHHEPHSALVEDEVHHGIRQGPGQPAIGDLPYLYVQQIYIKLT